MPAVPEATMASGGGVLERLAAISKLTERTYTNTLRRSTPADESAFTHANIARGVDLATRPPATDGHMVSAALERTAGGALWAGLPGKQVPRTAPPAGSHSAKTVAEQVVASKLKEHPDKKKRAVVGSVFSTSSAALSPDAASLARKHSLKVVAASACCPAAW